MGAALIAGAAGLAANDKADGQEHGGRFQGRILEKYDTNKNGVLDPEEKAVFEKDREARRAEFIKKFDTDGDGQLSDTERQAMREQMGAMGMGHGRHGMSPEMRQRMLDKYDVNKNGQLDPDEKAAFERDREARRAEFIKEFDTDGDGKLSDAEREAAREKYPNMGRHGRHGGGEMHARMLERYDVNKNGQLDPEEKAAFERDREARRAEMMKRFDTDGDGKLSESERQAMREEFRKEHGDREF